MAGPSLTLGYESALETAANVLALTGTQSVSEDAFVNFPPAAVTVSFWIKTSDASGDAVLFAYDANGADTANQILVKNAGDLTVSVGTGTTGATSAAVNDGAWHQVALVLEPYRTQHTAVTVYVDGAPVFESVGVLPATAFESSGNLVLGRTAVAGAEPSLAGDFSEFRLWNGARTQAQIATDMQVRAAGLSPQPVKYWALTSAATSGTLNGTPNFVASNLNFRAQSFAARWTEIPGAATYNLLVQEQNGCWQPLITGVTGLNSAITTYSIHARYSARVQAVVNANPGPWSDAALATLINLPPIVATLAGNTTQKTIEAQWSAVDQALAYAFLTYQDGATDPTSSTSVTVLDQDLTTLLQDADHWWRYAIRGDTTGGSLGPASAIIAVEAPVLVFRFQNDAQNQGTLRATWDPLNNAQYAYLSVDQTNGAPPGIVATALAAADAPDIDVTPAPADGAALSARLRAAAAGTIGQWSPAQAVTVQRFPPPLITSTISNATDHTIEVHWTIDSQVENLTYEVQLYNATGTTKIDEKTVTVSSATFTDDRIIDDSHFRVKVQATVTGSYSLWSDWKDVAVDGLPSVPLNPPTVDAPNNITVTWSRPADMPDTANYNVSINSPTPQSVVLVAPVTTTTFKQTDTQVVANETYTIRMFASDPSQQNGITTTATVDTKPTVQPPPDNPNSPDQGDPVNTTEGTYVYGQKLLGLQNPVPLEFGVNYASSRPTNSENPLFPDGPLSPRWTHIYATTLIEQTENGRVWVLWGDGAVDSYQIPTSIIGNYPKLGVQSGDSLALGEDQIYRLRRKNQMVFVFDRNGVMTRFETPNGNAVSLSYDGSGRLETVADPNTAKSFTFAYDGSNRLETVTDNANRSVSFGYGGGNLTTITNAGGGSRQLAYTGTALLETVTGETGEVFLKNTYSTELGSERVTFQQDGRAIANGDSYGQDFNYSRVSLDQVDYIVCAYADRQGNATRYTSVEANGNAVEVAVDLPGNQVLRTTSNYDGNGNLLTARVYRGATADYAPGKGNFWQFTFDGNNNLLTATDPLGQVSAMTYDERNQMTSATDTLGNTMTYHYDSDGLKWVENFAGERTTFEYESGAIKGLPKTITDGTGNVFAFTYYPNGLVQTATDPKGSVARMTYFDTGLPSQIVIEDAGGTVLVTRSYTYWGDGLTATETVLYPGQDAANAYVSTYDYYPDDRVQSFVNAGGATFNYGYDANALLESATYPEWDGVQRQIVFGYDRNDYPNRQVASSALGIENGFTYNSLGELISLTDPGKFVYGYTFEPKWINDQLFDLEVTETRPLLEGQTTPAYTNGWRFDALGRLIETVDAEDHTTSIAYSTRQDVTTQQFHSVQTVTMPPVDAGDDPYTQELVYDPLNRLLSYQDQANKTTTYSYGVEQNPADNLFYSTVTITDPEQRTTMVTSDPNGYVSKTVVGAGAEAIEREYRHDALGRLVEASEIQSGGNPIVTRYNYSYDAVENKIKVEVSRDGDPTVLSTQYLDALGQLTKEVDANSAPRTFDYSNWGALSGYTDAAGKSLAYKFDSAGRFIRTNLPDATHVARALDANGNVTAVSNGAGPEITRGYDNWNRLTSRTNADGAAVGYDYNPTSTLKTLTYPDLKTVGYTYDGLNRMSTVTDWADRVTNYGYSPVGEVTSITLPNGVLTTLGYDDSSQLTSIDTKKDANIVAQLGYMINSAGLRTEANSILPYPPELPTDTATIEYNSGNQATSYNGIDLQRTADGSLITLPGSGASVDLSYDDLNRVISVGTDTYTYDLEGHRIETDLSGQTKKYVIDPGTYSDPRLNYPLFQPLTQNQLYADSLGTAGQLPSNVAPGPAYPSLVTRPLDRSLEIRDEGDQVLQRLVYGIGLLNLEEADGQYRAFHFDSRGSTLALSDEQGWLTDRYAYDIYGALNARAGHTANPYLYNGRDGVMDDGNGLLYMRSRCFAPNLFNFAQRDIIFGDPFEPQSLDRYSYVQNNPISIVDPLGFTGSNDTWKWVLGGIGLGILGLAAIVGVGAAAIWYFYGPAFAAGWGGAIPNANVFGAGGVRVAQFARGLHRLLSRAFRAQQAIANGAYELMPMNAGAAGVGVPFAGGAGVGGGGVVVGGGGVGGGAGLAGAGGAGGGVGGVGLGAGAALLGAGVLGTAAVLGTGALLGAGGSTGSVSGGGGEGALSENESSGGGLSEPYHPGGSSAETERAAMSGVSSQIPPMQQFSYRPSGSTRGLRRRVPFSQRLKPGGNGE